MIYRMRRRPKVLMTIDDVQVLILHHHLMSMYEAELAKLYEAQGQPELSKFHRLLSNQQNNMRIFYKSKGDKMQMQREVFKVRDWLFSVGLVALMMGLLIIAPVMAQEATVEPTLPVVIDEVEPVPDGQPPIVVVNGGLSEGAQIAIIVVIAAAIIGGGTLLYVAVKGLRDSYPPGTATSFEKTWEAINKKATETINPYDDLAVDIAQPLIDAIVKAIRDKELVLAAEVPAGDTGKLYTRRVIMPDDTQPLPPDELG